MSDEIDGCSNGNASEDGGRIREESLDLDLVREYEQWDFVNNEMYEKLAKIVTEVNGEEGKKIEKGQGANRGMGGRRDPREQGGLKEQVGRLSDKFGVSGGREVMMEVNRQGEQGDMVTGEKRVQKGQREPERQKGPSKQGDLNKRQRMQLTNTVQRWLIHINERYNDVPKYEWFCLLPAVSVDHSAWIFLRDAIVEKRFVKDRSSADKTIDRLFTFIKDKHKSIAEKYELEGSRRSDKIEEVTIDRDPLKIKYDSASQLFIVEKFQSRQMDRLVFLFERGGLRNMARLLLRYESLGTGSYQWGQPQEVHDTLYHLFGVRFEGFASPINSRFIEYSDTRFCSLFPDTDEEFGSLGDFFNINMDEYKGGWSVNPPFVNDLMLHVSQKIVMTLDTGAYWWFFCTFPCWEDDPGWIMLNRSKHLVKRFDLKPQQYLIQDAYGKKFWPAVNMTLFVLGEVPIEKARLTELGKVLIRDSFGSHEDDCPW